MQNVKLGSIGFGWMGQLLGRVAAELPYVTLCAASDPVEQAAAKAQELGARVYTDYTEMLNKERLDGVIIATPEAMHVDPVIQAADAGCHIFLEKPIARTIAEADQIISACKEHGRKLMIGYLLRFEPAYVAIKQAIQRSDIGKFKSAYARRNGTIAEAKRLGGRTSVTNYIAVHDIDQILWYNEGVDVKSVYAKAVRGQVQKELGTWDFSWMMFEFRDGSLGVVETGWGLPKNSWGDSKMNVIGTSGQFSLDFTPMNVMAVDKEGWKFPITRLWPIVQGRIVGAVKYEVEHFISCLLNDREPAVTGEDGRRSLEVSIAAEMSIEQAKEIKLPL